MQVTINLKCDRSGRVQEKQVDSAEIPKYEARQKVRENALEKVREALKQIPPEELPDLICVYRGNVKAFVNVIPEFNDSAVDRLLEQLFHVSDPSARVAKARQTRSEKKPAEEPKEPKDNKKGDKKGGKAAVQEKATPGV